LSKNVKIILMHKWHCLNLKEILSKLNTDQLGLDLKQAQQRLKKYGANVLPQPKRLSGWKLFLEQFHNPLVYVLLIIIIVSFWLGHLVDGFFILLVVLVNSVVGYVQESKADKALEKLGQAIKLKARVIRSGREHEILARQLVPGDIIIIKAGDQVPADARLIKAQDLKVSQTSLTGEFWAVPKQTGVMPEATVLADQSNMVWMGTIVEKGTGKAVVVSTGQASKIGSLALVIKKTKKEKTPLQKKMIRFSRWLALGIVGFIVFLIGLGFFLGYSFLDIFFIATALAVSAIPEGLLPVVTVILIMGMRRILKKKGLVRRLSAAETLGSTDVICFDKTGTLTSGNMKVRDVIAPDINMAWHIIVNCNEAILDNDKIIGRPTDKAMLTAGLEAGFKKNKLVQSFLPFDSDKKYLASVINNQLLISGAPEILLNRSNLSENQRKKWSRQLRRLAKQGFRVVALGYKDKIEFKRNKIYNFQIQDLIFAGLVVLEDPLRSDIRASIDLCQRAGLRPVVVTGDHLLTARRVANEAGLEIGLDNIIEGGELNNLSSDQLDQRIREIKLFSRVTPKQKLRIIDSWQRQGKVVAMTGDGVNDSLALKKADIGVAMASGVDVTKQVADLVLLNNSFSTIISAIKQGRIIFADIKKAILYLLATDFSEIIIITAGVIFGLPLPLLPAQILWINLIEDSVPAFTLSFETEEKGIMTPQAKASQRIFDRPMKLLLIFIALFSGLTCFVLFLFLLFKNFDLNKARTIVFAVEVLSSLFFMFSCRSLKHTIWRKDIFSNHYLVGSVALGLFFLLIAIYLPWMQWILKTTSLNIIDWLMVLASSAASIVLIELFKKKFVIDR